MKKIFTHENRMILFNIKNVLEGEGMETVVVNEFASGGAGDLPTFDTWPELWLEDESGYERARTILRRIFGDNDAEAWFCRGCNEKIEAAFRICWNCGHSME